MTMAADMNREARPAPVSRRLAYRPQLAADAAAARGTARADQRRAGDSCPREAGSQDGLVTFPPPRSGLYVPHIAGRAIA
jgi:hypothetical protein